ncbi:MAG: TIGR03619 family F420-dependent LLM class oxidoreductase, partial [Pseudomonadota bacterium]
MKIGLLAAPNERSANPADLARAAEALGFESLWVPEHPILPVNPATKFPTGGEIPNVYSHMGDQVVALAMAAAVTTRLRLATGICLVPEHNPLVLANQLASLDAFSGGRLILGIGAGWLREESELLGVDFPRRWTQTAEYVAAMRELWRKPETGFVGKYVKFTPVRLYPKPAQPDGPPVVIGSLDKNALKRVAKWGDGWCPIGVPADYLKKQLAALREECQAAGTGFDRLDITVMGAIPGDRAKVQE